jgi:membrane-anchored protein YejM (alkaline phosphatase superfamily)
MEAQLSAPVRSLLERLRDASRKTCVRRGTSGGVLPSVVVVVVESFRSDVVTDELMPRLARYARGGARFDGHMAGSILSEAGLFTILYSESPLLYDAALDAGRKPCAVEAFSALGYRTAYFSGQPERWRRQEEFIGASRFDDYHHDDSGSWAEWDRRALEGAAALARTSPKPVFAVAYLMSSHFEYRFPPEYAVDKPVESASTWPSTNMRTLGGAEAPVIRNRYRNTMRFLDDLIMDAVGALDPAHAIVVVTGDHGESLFDDGRIGHGYSFADVVVKTPAIVVGPGVSPNRRSDATLHVDLLPTVLHAATGGAVRLDGVDGRDLFDQANLPREAVLLAAADVGRKLAIAELRDGVGRLDLQIRLSEGIVTWDGLRDPLGKWAESQRLDAAGRRNLVRAFERVVGDIAPR